MRNRLREELYGATFMSLLYGGVAGVFAAHDKIAWGFPPAIAVLVFVLVCLNAW